MENALEDDAGIDHTPRAGEKVNPVLALSVVIPTYNRASLLRRCLDALEHQTYPADGFEVIVVVDGSSDETLEMLQTRSAPHPLRVCWQSNQGVGAARNHGIEVAAGEFCLFLDDDVTADPQLVAEHIRIQRLHGGVVGLGRLGLVIPSNADAFARWLAADWNRHYAYLENGATPSFTHCYSGNMSAPTRSLRAIQGFATDLPRSEDVEIGYRLIQSGLSIVYIPDAVGQQEYSKGFQEIAADAEKAGFAALELYRRHAAMLPRLRLARYRAATLCGVLLRRLLLMFAVPDRMLSEVDRVLRSDSWRAAWFHFLYDYYYWRGVRCSVPDRDTWRRLTAAIPILMYHAFGEKNEQGTRYVMPARRFARQMAWLRLRRYTVLTVGELMRYRREYRLPPARSVVITADDGYTDTWTVAYPILRRHGFSASLFLVSGAVGGTNAWDHGAELEGRALLEWEAIRDMVRHGIEVGAHTRRHVRLPALPQQQAREEVEGSRLDLERELGLPVQVFAYPYGKVDAASESVVQNSGFLAACGVESHLNTVVTPAYRLGRAEIYGTHSFARFLLALSIGRTHLRPGPRRKSK